MLFKASAPGSLMILGEYAVLQGAPALVCAVNKRLSVTLVPRNDQTLMVHSALGDYKTELNHITIADPFRYVLSVLKQYETLLPQGCDITIQSEFVSTIGFGSSAAVTVALIKALNQWLNVNDSDDDLILKAREIIRSVQGVGSGADVAASVYGGLISYQSEPLKVKKLSYIHPLTVIYSGKKTPTPEAIQKVYTKFADDHQALDAILKHIQSCSKKGIGAAEKGNWSDLGKAMSEQQIYMDQLGVNTQALENIIKQLQNKSEILGTKISGSGFGDCAIGLGAISELLPEAITVEMSMQGVHCE